MKNYAILLTLLTLFTFLLALAINDVFYHLLYTLLVQS